MDKPRRSFRPSAESLEGRLALSAAGAVAPSLGTAAVHVPRPKAVATATIPVASGNIAKGRRSAIIGLTARPSPGSTLRPKVVGAGKAAFHPGAPFKAPNHRFAQGYARVAKAGPLAAQVTGASGTTGDGTVTGYLAGDIDGNGRVDYADLKLFESAYLSKAGGHFYNLAADANRNGFVGQGDAKFILRNFPKTIRKTPLKVELALAKGQYSNPTGLHDSGGISQLHHVTVVGRTTPGAFVFADSGLGDYRFRGPVRAADANGYFSFDFDLDPEDQLHNTEYLVIDRFGQQKIRAFPLLLSR